MEARRLGVVSSLLPYPNQPLAPTRQRPRQQKKRPSRNNERGVRVRSIVNDSAKHGKQVKPLLTAPKPSTNRSRQSAERQSRLASAAWRRSSCRQWPCEPADGRRRRECRRSGDSRSGRSAAPTMAEPGERSVHLRQAWLVPLLGLSRATARAYSSPPELPDPSPQRRERQPKSPGVAYHRRPFLRQGLALGPVPAAGWAVPGRIKEPFAGSLMKPRQVVSSKSARRYPRQTKSNRSTERPSSPAR